MSEPLSRRDLLKTLGVAGAGMMLPGAVGAEIVGGPGIAAGVTPTGAGAPAGAAPVGLLPLTSTSEVFIPPRGRGYQKFSFDFPEPAVPFAGLRFSFLVFTFENTYGLDAGLTKADGTDDEVTVESTGLVWAGGQEKVPGHVTARIRKTATGVEWDVVAEMDQPVKAVTTVIRGVPRGALSFGAGNFYDHRNNEVLVGYPFSGGDLFGGNAAGGMTTPLAMVKSADDAFFAISSLDDRVRTKRFYFQPGPDGYRVEAIHEGEGWIKRNRLEVPTWRIVRATTAEAAYAPHFAHLEKAYHLQPFDTRPDVPSWMRDLAMVTTLHGMHYTGYIFNDYARMLEILRWMATQIPPDRVMAFISAWDGRYYWDYPKYTVSERMGGEAGFRTLVEEAQRMGFRIMPMYGTNTANRNQPIYARMADAATAKIDGDAMDLNWVDWDNDRHQEGWLSYMNMGVDSWREWMESRIDDMIGRFGVDAYFLDIVGGWTNNTKADMHEGVRRLVADLHAKYPTVPCVGEMHYDALLEFIPMYHAGGGGIADPGVRKYAHFFQHLSHPAPGRGSTGVHEAGFGRFDPKTLDLSPIAIPTLNVVDDTFDKYRDLMAAVIAKAKERAGIA